MCAGDLWVNSRINFEIGWQEISRVARQTGRPTARSEGPPPGGGASMVGLFAVTGPASSLIRGVYGSTVTSTNAGMLSAPFLSVTRNLKRKSFGSETEGARKEAFGMLRSRSGTFAPRTWLQV
jgi:hypothetical protein